MSQLDPYTGAKMKDLFEESKKPRTRTASQAYRDNFDATFRRKKLRRRQNQQKLARLMKALARAPAVPLP